MKPTHANRGTTRHARRSLRHLPTQKMLLATAASVFLGGCASTAMNDNFSSVQQTSKKRLGTEVKWLTTDEARAEARSDVDALLAQPLDADGAVRIALAYSPALQALLYESAAGSAAATQSARLPNPVFAFERLLRTGGGVHELELTRSLSFSVFDLLLLPTRLRLADDRQQVTRLTLAADVVQAAANARRAWVSAVAAQQAVQYAQQVKATADAGAELARRMQAVGNYSKLQRAQEQVFSADAVAQLARSAQAARGSREALIRALGLNDSQAAALQLPERLPDLPAQPDDEARVAQAAMDQRLDVQTARANLDFVAREQGLTRVTSLVDGLTAGPANKTETGLSTKRGTTVSAPLPLFDFGDAARAGAQATYMAAFYRAAQLTVDAHSQVRERYGAYRTAYDLARHYRDEIVPLRQTIAAENVLRYNGMLISVFELLAGAREQIASVASAIEAQRDFWLADAALQSTLIGSPMASMSSSMSGSMATSMSTNSSGASLAPAARP